MEAATLTRRHSLWDLLNPLAPLRSLWTHRGLIGQLTTRNIHMRYRGAVLGLLWSLLLPVIMLVVYTFVFGVVFESRWRQAGDDSPILDFALALYCGLLAYNVFSETCGAAPGLVVGQPSFVKKVVFPLEILPVCSLGTALFNMAVGGAVLLVVTAVAKQTFSMTIIYLPLVLGPLLLLSIGVAWFLASLGVFLRDTVQVTAVVLQVLLFLTPIFYPVERVPEVLKPVLYANPLTPIVDGFRQTLLWGEMPNMAVLAAVWVLSVIVMQLGYAWFMKTRRGFADVL
jgi:lipopolysaccharide transport system permease protein